MEIKDILKQEFSHIELYLAKKAKIDPQTKMYTFKKDTLVNLDLYNPNNNFEGLFNKIREYLNSRLATVDQLHEYSIENGGAYDLCVDNNIQLDYNETLVKQLCSLALIESEEVNFNYLLFKAVSHDKEDFMLWIKLKSPVKVRDQNFSINHNSFTLSIHQDKIVTDNYFNFKFEVENIAFMYYKKDFYIIESSLYQNYFNLKTQDFLKAEETVYNSESIISDGAILTKQNVKLINVYFQNVEDFVEKIHTEEINKHKVIQTINELDLNLIYDESNNKFILKKPSDLKDIILLASDCLGINKLTERKFRVRRPDFLE